MDVPDKWVIHKPDMARTEGEIFHPAIQNDAQFITKHINCLFVEWSTENVWTVVDCR